MTSLEQVIKDLEFENESLIRQVKDEIETIDNIQNEMRRKSGENEKMVEEIEHADKEVKSLHDQLKQNKEITESLKSASTLLQKHHEDLKKVLALKSDETQRQKLENEKKLSEYEKKWSVYEQEYEKHPIAKEIRQYKLESVDLDEKVKQLAEERNRLQETFNDIDGSKLKKEKAKSDAMKAIMELANIYVSGKSNRFKCKQMLFEERQLNEKIAWKKRECAKLTSQLEERKREKAKQPSWVVNKPQLDNKRASNVNHYPSMNSASIPRAPSLTTPMAMTSQSLAQKLQHQSSISLANSTKVFSPNNAPTPANTPVFNKASSKANNVNKKPNFQPLKMPSLPKIPVLPKFLSVPKFTRPQIATPNNTTPLVKPPILANPPPDTGSPIVNAQIKPALHGTHAPQLPSGSKIPRIDREDVPSPSVDECRNDVETEVSDVDKERKDTESIDTFSAPLDQPVNEFLEENHAIVCGSSKKAPLTPLLGDKKYSSFSPGMHAQQLKLLKQSPGDMFQRASRPMFEAKEGECEESKIDGSDFAQSFSDQANFNGFNSAFLSSSDASSQSDGQQGREICTETSKESPQLNFTFATPSLTAVTGDSETSPAGKRDHSETKLNNQSTESEASGFSFENAAFSPDDANFNFGGSGTDFSVSSDNTFSFDMASSSNDKDGGIFNTVMDTPQSSSMFNFGNSSTPGTSFAFDSPGVGKLNSDTPVKSSPFAFSFGGSSDSPKDNPSSDFSFNFG